MESCFLLLRSSYGVLRWKVSCQIVRAAEAHYGRSVTLEEACRYGWENIRLKVKGGSWRVYVSRQIAGLASDDEREQCRKIYRELKAGLLAQRNVLMLWAISQIE